MSRDIKPLHSKGQIDRAGDNIRKGCAEDKDIGIIENWRASHNHILNSWQATLRNRISKSNYNVVFAQRLKRKNTIYDKLTREPKMNLSRMEDIAGCRLIFDNIDDLHNFRNELHCSRMLHQRRYSDKKPYPRDYISHPKSSGYRGIHDIYSTKARKGRPDDWDGLHVEIQYRTIYQHAWATAVETAGYLTGNPVKFDRGSEQHKRFFLLASGVLARAYENDRSFLGELSDAALIDDLKALENEINLLRILKDVRKAAIDDRKEYKNIILKIDHKNKGYADFESYKSIQEAILAYVELEKRDDKLDIRPVAKVCFG